MLKIAYFDVKGLTTLKESWLSSQTPNDATLLPIDDFPPKKGLIVA